MSIKRAEICFAPHHAGGPVFRTWSTMRGSPHPGPLPRAWEREESTQRFLVGRYSSMRSLPGSKRVARQLRRTTTLAEQRARYDSTRSEQLARVRVRVLRFRNRDVLRDIDRVCAEIQEALGAEASSLAHTRGRGQG